MVGWRSEGRKVGSKEVRNHISEGEDVREEGRDETEDVRNKEREQEKKVQRK